ncbi:TIGR01440 family protein [Anaerobacillus alkalilacustris]|uniref:TIGR01440 family protein n=1 Tax=Anaerobacillus alkalilacustris TaxID=393763 RepID=UPI000B017C31
MVENSITEEIYEQLLQALTDLDAQSTLRKGDILVVGTSTSEVIGKHIGTSGTKEVAGEIFRALRSFQEKTGVQLAFQCCEHLNRALVVEEKTQSDYNLEQVSVIPVPKAGGSMASYAYQHFENPVVVEFIKADAGVDIGDTLIGMHLKHVAVPVRSKIKMIGQAHLTLAKTRHKLIGGDRAVYEIQDDAGKCD